MEMKVSVIMPVYNMQAFVAESIESVLAQDYSNWELLLVDDGSTDNSRDICEEYLNRDSRIKYFYKENGGLPSARNHGIERASGDLLALLDSDDLWTSNKLSVCVAEFENGDQDLLFSSVYRFSDSSDILDLSKLKKIEVGDKVYQGAAGLKAFLLANRIHVPTVVVKKTALEAIGGVPNFPFAEDYCTWLLLLLDNYKFRTVNEPLSFYRVREDSMYHSADQKYRLRFKVLEFVIAKHPRLIGFKKELATFLKYYLAIEYDKAKKDELQRMMKVFQIDSPLVNFIIACQPILPLKVITVLMRLTL
ncbi:glycosyltransferase family 2 protein [Arcticibacter sp. MXS-1]|uniref:glycosyltransferase family 2 protein n=1 Tax=Arcticibacter sp. MXS-1 TaxID=3341726 RepID=UPI0035A8EE82